MAANNRHLTSFAVGLRRRSFVQNVCAGIKNLHTTSPESAVRNEYKYQLNPHKWRARFSGKIWMKFELKWRRNAETKYGVVEEIQNQNGVVVFSNLEDATKVVLVKLGMNNIGYLLHT